ncbi:hypothetical protein H5410_015738 [Solanum commersonii]|uniref:Uncharacterized protein n=1 Tax=Solanum commersonii TaxID=4109 RepID=A0A9J5ZVA4_SOLCO|nr:hypothetical protein H5410_015738 [Solanum commersonii]
MGLGHPLRLNLMSTHSLGHQSSGFGFATSLSGKPKTHRWLYCAAKDRSTTLIEITDELGDPPFNQLIAFSILPSASSYFGSLGSTASRTGTKGGACQFGDSPSWTRRSADFHFLFFLALSSPKCPCFQ